MKRFLITKDAQRDLDFIKLSLEDRPGAPALKIAHALKSAIYSIAVDPLLGAANSSLTRAFGQEVRSRFVHPYRIYYLSQARWPEIIAVLHGSRDAQSILAGRVQ